VGAELFYAEERTDKVTDMTKLIDSFAILRRLKTNQLMLHKEIMAFIPRFIQNLPHTHPSLFAGLDSKNPLPHREKRKSANN